MVAITTISSWARTMTRYNFRRFSTQMYLYKAFFLLHTSVTDTFEFKEILCLHSLNCIGIQIAFIFKLKASLTCLFDCHTVFPAFLLDRQLLAQKDVKRCKVLEHFKTYPVHIFKPSRIKIFLPESLKLFKE